MIVDDRWCIIGSANINDRSQLGSRDSEVALYVDDTKSTDSKMNGKSYPSGSFAGSIRRYLFAEHLGLLDSKDPDIDISDPTSPEFFNLWNNIAKRNTQIYEKVFECAPSDRLRTLEQYAANEENATRALAYRDPKTAAKLLATVRGHLVQYPLNFLADSVLTPPLLSPEDIMGVIVFV